MVHGDLEGLFDAPSTVAFDPAAPMLSIGLSRLGSAGDDTALVLAMTRTSAWMEADQLTAASSLLGLTGVEAQAVSALTKGRGLWKVAGRSFITQHLLHPWERELFDTDARMSG